MASLAAFKYNLACYVLQFSPAKSADQVSCCRRTILVAARGEHTRRVEVFAPQGSDDGDKLYTGGEGRLGNLDGSYTTGRGMRSLLQTE